MTARYPVLAALVISLSAPTSASPEIGVLTFNIRYGTARDENHRWDLRRDAVIAVIRDSAADFIGLQEALDFQVDEILEGLDGSHTLVGEGRDGGRSGEHSPILFDAGKYTLLRAGRFWLSDTPEVVGSKTWSDLPRIVTWVEVVSRDESARKFLLLNTHFSHVSDAARLSSAKLIVEKLKEIAPGGETSVVLMGDFNCRPGSEPHQTLTDPNAGGFQDAQLVTGSPGMKTFNGFREPLAAEGSPIDWILFRPGLHPKSYRVLHEKVGGVIPSDHHPVKVLFDVEAP